MRSYAVSSSTVVAGSPEAAYDAIVAAPLEELFAHRSGPIPPVARTEGPDAWGTEGQSRKVVLADGSTNVETLVGADRAALDYRYRLTDFTGPFRLLVRHVDGRFAFTPEGVDTRVTWSWALHPVNPVARLALPVLAAFWRRYAAGMWPRFEARVRA